MKNIENSLQLVKAQRELQVLLQEIVERKKRDNELMKRCIVCAKNVAMLKPLVKKELFELSKEERVQTNKLLKELYLKV